MEENQQREDVVYLYVRDFSYKDEQYDRMMGGHPKPGRIYRALFDKETSLYRVIVEEEDQTESKITGLMLHKLEGEDPRWITSMVEVDQEKLLELEIDTEDFKKLAKWQDNNNHDIDHLRLDSGVASINLDENTGITTVNFNGEEEEEEEDLTANLANLAELDYDLAKSVDKTIEGIVHYLTNIGPNTPDLTYMVSDHIRHGKGVNLGLAIEAISDYMNNEPSSKGILNKAVYYLLREMARINK